METMENKQMLTLPNILSLLRIPLALVFLQENPFYRVLAIVVAMMSDGLDGFIARRYQSRSQVGTFLDPLTDKFFAIFLLTVLVGENRLSALEAAALVCRDFSVLIFGIYLVLSGNFYKYQFRSIWSGKLTTFLQFIVFIGLTFQTSFPATLYATFLILGFLALLELYCYPVEKKA
jgi:CDP-diacylglycerol---glycerol-3-phosphate 3-phosphatidyltransferase